MDKLILDATCGKRSIWFQKNEPHTVYCDKRVAFYESYHGTIPRHRTINVDPDIVCDFTALPFPDNTFSLCVLDPPHLIGKDESWTKKSYGYYDTKDEAIENVAAGIKECMRVLKVGGVLVFKLSELQVPSREIINACGIEPLFGHRSGKKSNTHWMLFMKFEEEASG